MALKIHPIFLIQTKETEYVKFSDEIKKIKENIKRPVFLEISKNGKELLLKGRINSITFEKIYERIENFYNGPFLLHYQELYSKIALDEDRSKWFIDSKQFQEQAQVIKNTKANLSQTTFFVCPIAFFLDDGNSDYRSWHFIGDGTHAIVFFYETKDNDSELTKKIIDFQKSIYGEKKYRLMTMNDWQNAIDFWFLNLSLVDKKEINYYLMLDDRATNRNGLY